jgi:NAD(P)-dependent dehydrogenase (short-subunit alcohol dehydrogenase family)
MADSATPKVWFVTGASRGFGLEITRAALADGDRVVATARHAETIRAELPDAGAGLVSVDLDTTSPAQALLAVRAALDAFGRIDVVVNNAGRGLLSAVEEASDEAIRVVYEVNVFGTLNVLRAVLPVLRAQRSGRIVNITSVGGLVGSAGWGIYNSTKFAVEGFSEALSKELAPLGIGVTIVEPGTFRTDFLDGTSLDVQGTAIPDYEQTAGAVRARVRDFNHAQPGDPAKAAAAILEATKAADPPLHLLLGTDCVTRVEAKTRQLLTDIDTWRQVSTSTDHDPEDEPVRANR